jgi:DNA-binding XRE family transcriptional regulator
MPYKGVCGRGFDPINDLVTGPQAMRYPISNSTLDAGDIAILGRKGSGKTYAAKGLAERLIKRGKRVVVIDPMAVWWGLRHGGDDATLGLPVVVLGGVHGDLPLPHDDEGGGRQVARFILATDVSVVVDVSELRSPDNLSFVAALINELYETHTSEQSITVVLEEADMWAPQVARSKQDVAVLREVDTLVRRGRRRGFQVLTITQRPASLAKNILSQFDTLATLALPGLQDRKAVRDWLDGVTPDALNVFNSLPTLDVGEAWIWTPHGRKLVRERFPAITTLDTSQTPRRSDRRVMAGTLSAASLLDLQQVLERIQGKTGCGEPRQRRQPTATVAGRAIADLRERLRLTQAELGEKVGSDQKTISRIESGVTFASSRILEKIAAATDCELVMMFRRK